jgi:hypothetical protein
MRSLCKAALSRLDGPWPIWQAMLVCFHAVHLCGRGVPPFSIPTKHIFRHVPLIKATVCAAQGHSDGKGQCIHCCYVHPQLECVSSWLDSPLYAKYSTWAHLKCSQMSCVFAVLRSVETQAICSHLSEQAICSHLFWTNGVLERDSIMMSQCITQCHLCSLCTVGLWCAWCALCAHKKCKQIFKKVCTACTSVN